MNQETTTSRSERGFDRDFAVVGTDTGVGKTIVTAGLVGWLRNRGVEAHAVKPVQTGYPPDDDATVVTDACETNEAATCGHRLEPPLAPAVAADETGVDLSYPRIVEECQRTLANAEVGVLEGIGGLRVPLTETTEVVDLVAALGLPALVVSRSGLGTLNHTALTVEALRRRKIPVHGVVLNRYEGETTAERTNPSVLERMTNCPVWTLPPISVEPRSEIVSGVEEHLPVDVLPK